MQRHGLHEHSNKRENSVRKTNNSSPFPHHQNPSSKGTENVISAGAQFLHQQKVLGLGPLVVVDKDLLIKGPTKTKHTRTTKRKSMNLRNLKMLLYPRHSKLTTHRHVIVSLSLGLRLVSPSVVDSQLKLRLPAAQLLLSRDIPKLVSESLQFLSSS